MSKPLIAACVQNCASADVAASMEESVALTRDARRQGAELICLPEFFSCLSVTSDRFEVGAHPESEHPVLRRFSALASALGCWLLLGSVAVRAGEGRVHNRSYLLDSQGRIVARYDKIHLFDIDLSRDETYRESAWVKPGAHAVLADTPWGRVGLSVCYDLRFPHLYRDLAKAGAEYLFVPAAFTKTTGEAHWHVLNRARAIENGAYVLAPCQYGVHGKAATYGHSLIVDPWGVVLADGGTDPGVIVAELDPREVAKARQKIPSLTHDRRYRVTKADPSADPAPPDRIERQTLAGDA